MKDGFCVWMEESVCLPTNNHVIVALLREIDGRRHGKRVKREEEEKKRGGGGGAVKVVEKKKNKRAARDSTICARKLW